MIAKVATREPFVVTPRILTPAGVTPPPRLRVAAHWVHDESCAAEYGSDELCERKRFCGYLATVEIWDGRDGLGEDRWLSYLREDDGVWLLGQHIINQAVREDPDRESTFYGEAS